MIMMMVMIVTRITDGTGFVCFQAGIATCQHALLLPLKEEKLSPGYI